MRARSRHVALVCWSDHDALARALGHEVRRAGYTPEYFRFDRPPPHDAAIVFSFAPYGRWIQIPRALAHRAPRPLFLHWNTENPPDLRLPWIVVKTLGAARSRMDRWHDSPDPAVRERMRQPLLQALDKRLFKFRYVGEYYYAARRGWLDVFAESSEIYGELHRAHGLDAKIVPWGTVPEWCADLGLERDIDVFWFGQRRTSRRSRLLDQLRGELQARGLKVYVADGVEQEFVHGEARTRLLNRSKMTLNLLPTWYDHAFPYRFHVAAGNRSLVVTEPLLKHSSHYVDGAHYVSAPIPELADRMAYYARHERARRALAEQAFELVTKRMTMGHSVRALMQYVEAARGNA